MRLDKFLKVSRLIKRRTEAKKACLAKCIRINDRIAKAGDEVKITDEIEINLTDKILRVKVLEVPLKNILLHIFTFFSFSLTIFCMLDTNLIFFNFLLF